MKPVIAVIFGGTSQEHDISLLSAMSLIENMNHDLYDVLQIGIAKNGDLYVGPDVLLKLKHNKDTEELTPCSISTNPQFPGVFI